MSTKMANAYMNKFKENMFGGINTISIGKIERFDPIKMMADVLLIPGDQLIINVPVGAIQTSDFFIRIPYKKGDVVLVGFAQQDIDGVMYGGNASETDRRLSLDDAVVLCGINLFTNSMPSEHADKLVIGEKSGAKIVIGGGKISLLGAVDVNGVAITAGGSSV